MEKKIPIIIDTDPGVDDAIAIFLANSLEGLAIKGLTTVGGNVSGDKTFNNARGLAHHIGLDVPIARGADYALIARNEDASWVHGESGMGKLQLPLPERAADTIKAWDFIYEEAIKAKGDLVLVPVAPLTNIAITLLKYPQIKPYIKEIRLMGGSATYGNHSPYGEFNIWGDPHAADIVFKSGIPIKMVGLNVTMAAYLLAEEMTAIKSIPCKIQAPMIALFEQMDFLGETFGFTTRVAHDALVVASLCDPDLITFEPYHVAIETGSDINMGRTIVDRHHCSGQPLQTEVAMAVKRERFVEMLLDMMHWYAKQE